MKTITAYLTVRDNAGNIVTGASLYVYPAGTTNGSGITITDLGDGNYKIVFTPATDVQCMAKLYDVYLGSTKKMENVFFEDWVWFVSDIEVKKEKTVNFANLTDENGLSLPATISYAEVKIVRAQTDRTGYISSVSSSSFIIGVAEAGSSDYGKFNLEIKKTK